MACQQDEPSSTLCSQELQHEAKFVEEGGWQWFQ